jgi:hypothetical protein
LPYELLLMVVLVLVMKTDKLLVELTISKLVNISVDFLIGDEIMVI